MNAVEDPLAGTMYRFVARLGAGGMGEVVEAEHRTLGTRLAVKLLHKEHFFRFELKERMRVEAQTCARLRHDNLVLVSDFDETPEGRAFVVMELLRGNTLGDELERRGALPVLEALDIAAQALSGLAAAHAVGLVHRDIKPDNLFLCEPVNGVRRVKVLDFGIAKIVDAGRDPRTPLPLMVPTAEGMAVGTPRYASPEQSRGERDLDARSDVYSMGWVLHAMLTGCKPFPDRSALTDLWRAHEHEMPPLVSAMSPDRPIAPELDRAVVTAIAKRREDRFASAEDFRGALVGCAEALAAAPKGAPAAFGGTVLLGPGTAAPSGGPTAAATVAARGPAERAGSSTVQLAPPAAGIRTVLLDGNTAPRTGHLPAEQAPTGSTVDATRDASQRPVLPWGAAPTPASRPASRRPAIGVLVLVALVIVACGVIVAVRALGVA